MHSFTFSSKYLKDDIFVKKKNSFCSHCVVPPTGQTLFYMNFECWVWGWLQQHLYFSCSVIKNYIIYKWNQVVCDKKYLLFSPLPNENPHLSLWNLPLNSFYSILSLPSPLICTTQSLFKGSFEWAVSKCWLLTMYLPRASSTSAGTKRRSNSISWRRYEVLFWQRSPVPSCKAERKTTNSKWLGVPSHRMG